MNRSHVVARVLILILVGAAFGAVPRAAAAETPQTFHFNLAQLKSGTSDQRVQVSSGLLRVVIVNKSPRYQYVVDAEQSSKLLEPLKVPGDSGGSTGLLLLGNETAECTALKQAVEDLKNAADEKDVPGLVDKVSQQAAVVEKQPGGTAACLGAGALDKVLAATQEELSVDYDMAPGDELKVTVQRTDKQWVVTYFAPQNGTFLSTYGFTFIPSRDRLYFTQAQAGVANKFTITPKNRLGGSTFAPSLFYSWLPLKAQGNTFSYGWTAGLGFDLSNPIVFAGGIATYHQNLSLVAGVVMHKEKRLNGKYSSGQVVSENLDDTQLHEDSYRPAAFFGVSYRFGSNPFKTSSGSNPSQPAAKSKPATGTTPPQPPGGGGAPK